MTPMAQITRMGALKIADPERWEKEIRQAMKRSQGACAPAAEELGVSLRQLMRWLAELPDVPRRSGGRPWPEK